MEQKNSYGIFVEKSLKTSHLKGKKDVEVAQKEWPYGKIFNVYKMAQDSVQW
jgi:hypothetical protein